MTLSFYQHAKSQTSRSKIGTQAHQLTKLLDAGLPIPKGFLVAADTCRAFFLHSHLQDKIKLLLERCNYHDPQDLVRVARNINKLILAHEFPHEAAESLLEASMKLSNERVMLTASPLGSETTLTESRPLRIYGVTGESNILLAIRTLWASQFAADDLYYIYTTEDHEFPCMAICVQVLPEAIVSGILSTTDGKDKQSVMAHIVWGEGAYQRKLQGADTYWINKQTGNESDALRNLQTVSCAWENDQLITTKLSLTAQKKQKLTTNLAKDLVLLAQEVQQKLFYPQEVTFAYDGKKIYLIETQTSSPTEHVVTHQPSVQTKRVLLRGVGAAPGIITGTVRVVRSNSDNNTHPGEIVVARSLSLIANNVLRSAQGIIIEEEMRGEAVIELAQKGIALLMSAAGATDLLEPGSFITLHTPRGEVLAGGYTAQIRLPEEPLLPERSATRIGTILALGNPIGLPAGTLRGHLILSPHKLIRQVGIHPLALAHEHKNKVLTNHLTEALTNICNHFPQEPLLYAFSNFNSDEYATLKGAQIYETLEERNPQLGYFGLTRILQNPELLTSELEALNNVRRQLYGKHISLLIPPARSSQEIREFEKVLSSKNLARSAGCRHFLDLSIPSLIWEMQSIVSLVDGVILNLDNIYAHLFAHDPSCDSIRLHISDIETTLLAIIIQAQELCKKEGLVFILRGSLLEHDSFLSCVVSKGIGEVVVAPKLISVVRQRLISLEQEHINHV